MNDQENQLIREMTTDMGPFEEQEPIEPNDSNETGAEQGETHPNPNWWRTRYDNENP